MGMRVTKESEAAIRSRMVMTRAQAEAIKREIATDPAIDEALKAVRAAYPRLGTKASNLGNVPPTRA